MREQREAHQTTHGNAEQSSDSQKLTIRLGKTCAQLQHNEENVIDDEGPFSAISVRGDTEDGGSNAPEHEHEGDAPGDVGVAPVERLGKVFDGQRDSEEVKCVPGPSKECNEEEHPLLEVEHHQELDRVGCFSHRRLEGAESRRRILAWTHAMLCGIDVIARGRRGIARQFLVVIHVEQYC